MFVSVVYIEKDLIQEVLLKKGVAWAHQTDKDDNEHDVEFTNVISLLFQIMVIKIIRDERQGKARIIKKLRMNPGSKDMDEESLRF
ncbi:hypothetical protein QVD17_21134 [Tagetes erecta]|uniref:Uncharacterized protein n=1 Tax=Tagetes erecta TaxID=13708 RepID=A0AAD8NYT9_TARER|nr:hypothetical protein QVD17_21134 [Tagetes erecta]